MFGLTVGHYCKPPSAAPMMHHDALCLNGFQHISKKKGGCQDRFVLFLSEDVRWAPNKEARLLPLLQTSKCRVHDASQHVMFLAHFIEKRGCEDKYNE